MDLQNSATANVRIFTPAVYRSAGSLLTPRCFSLDEIEQLLQSADSVACTWPRPSMSTRGVGQRKTLYRVLGRYRISRYRILYISGWDIMSQSAIRVRGCGVAAEPLAVSSGARQLQPQTSPGRGA
jgi:hypothetical protein